jgi:hypothetical protein
MFGKKESNPEARPPHPPLVATSTSSLHLLPDYEQSGSLFRISEILEESPKEAHSRAVASSSSSQFRPPREIGETRSSDLFQIHPRPSDTILGLGKRPSGFSLHSPLDEGFPRTSSNGASSSIGLPLPAGFPLVETPKSAFSNPHSRPEAYNAAPMAGKRPSLLVQSTFPTESIGFEDSLVLPSSSFSGLKIPSGFGLRPSAGLILDPKEVDSQPLSPPKETVLTPRPPQLHSSMAGPSVSLRLSSVEASDRGRWVWRWVTSPQLRIPEEEWAFRLKTKREKQWRKEIDERFYFTSHYMLQVTINHVRRYDPSGALRLGLGPVSLGVVISESLKSIDDGIAVTSPGPSSATFESAHAGQRLMVEWSFKFKTISHHHGNRMFRFQARIDGVGEAFSQPFRILARRPADDMHSRIYQPSSARPNEHAPSMTAGGVVIPREPSALVDTDLVVRFMESPTSLTPAERQTAIHTFLSAVHRLTDADRKLFIEKIRKGIS